MPRIAAIEIQVTVYHPTDPSRHWRHRGFTGEEFFSMESWARIHRDLEFYKGIQVAYHAERGR